MRHHAFVVEAEAEQGIRTALQWAERELGVTIAANPDVIVLRFGLFSVAEARQVTELTQGAPFAGAYKVVILAARRVYHEAQNALLKLFEEPPPGTYLFLVLPTLGALLPTLRSRVHILSADGGLKPVIAKSAEEFLKANKERRSAIIQKLVSGKDEEERNAYRDEAIAIVNGVEAALLRQGLAGHVATLREIATLRPYLYDRSAPVKLILEHLSLVTPQVRS